MSKKILCPIIKEFLLLYIITLRQDHYQSVLYFLTNKRENNGIISDKCFSIQSESVMKN